MKVKVKSLSRAQLFAIPWTVVCTKLLHPWDFLGKSTGVGCRFLLQEIFPTQGSNAGLPHCRQTLYRLESKKYDKLADITKRTRLTDIQNKLVVTGGGGRSSIKVGRCEAQTIGCKVG